MNWIEIKDVSPNSPRLVLLGEFGKVPHYGLGLLGGSQSAPEIVCDGERGRKFTVSATHWCELVAP